MKTISIVFAALSAFLVFGQVSAQDNSAAFDPAAYDLAKGKKIFEKKATCLQCHGWDGAGMGRNPRSPGKPPSLRDFAAGPDVLRETIACGRPYTPMPYHDRAAYRDDRCYGLTSADFDDGEVPVRGVTLRPEEIDHLVAYLMTDVIGAGETTLAQCEKFYGTGHRNCARLAEK